jgi:hypothetical protein
MGEGGRTYSLDGLDGQPLGLEPPPRLPDRSACDSMVDTLECIMRRLEEAQLVLVVLDIDRDEDGGAALLVALGPQRRLYLGPLFSVPVRKEDVRAGTVRQSCGCFADTLRRA